MMERGGVPVRLESQGSKVVFGKSLSSDNEKRLRAFFDSAFEVLSKRREVVFDFSSCRSMETAPTAMVYNVSRRLENIGVDVEWRNLPEEGRALLASFERQTAVPKRISRAWSVRGIVEDIGESGRTALEVAKGLWKFSGRTTLATLSALLRPATVRWKMVRFYMEQGGVGAVPIIAVLCWLLGTVLGYMIGYQLKSFAAEAFMPDLISYAMVWEISPLIAAVLVAGRSGSAFAAEIGTMKVRQEVDALEVMGINVFGFLVTPKMLALMCVMPFLTLLADMAGLLGGLLIGGWYLDMPASIFIRRVNFVLLPIDFWWGMLKSIVYAVIIANVGCYMGMKVRGGAMEVGRATTSAVVTGIFMVILADALIAIAFMHVRPPLTI
ncbi:hypothetical protein GF402_01755 [Candidatus Fermentibacteria bacterium]|nr:hypothetical protein [Candidatus Fermentibacteria bacterium]